MNNLVLVTLIALHLRLVYCVDLPTDIQKCQYGDELCTKESINQIIKRYPKGIPELGISPFDEFKAGNLTLYDSPRVGGLWMTFNLIDQVLSGCENATVTRVSGFQKDPNKSKIEIELHIPRFIHRSKFEMQLRWLFMVHSNVTGNCFAEMQDINLILQLKVIVRFLKEKRYLRIYEITPQITLGRFFMKLDNLYIHNLDLTLAVNRVYNENWLELWNDIEPTLASSYGKKGAQLLDNIFETISYDDMFINK